jgi:hypothetical protein
MKSLLLFLITSVVQSKDIDFNHFHTSQCIKKDTQIFKIIKVDRKSSIYFIDSYDKNQKDTQTIYIKSNSQQVDFSSIHDGLVVSCSILG